jgi:peroxidase
LNLAPYASFAQLTNDPVLQKNLRTVYGSIDKVDLFIGGLAETPASSGVVGPTFQTIIRNQFDALRSGDRFFWLNQPFDPATSETIANTTLADIILRNTDTSALPSHVFLQSAAVATTTHAKRPAPVSRAMRPDAASAVNPAR